MGSGFLLLEGDNAILEAGKFVEFRFTPKDTSVFDELVTTETPQSVAAVARAPKWSEKDVFKRRVVVVLDHVQDPGNVGTILRSAQAFGAGVVLVESADPTSPKVVRSTAGAVFHTPWIVVKSKDTTTLLARAKRIVYRLENRPGAVSLKKVKHEPMLIVVGSEGSGIISPIIGKSLVIEHQASLESLNVAVATSIALYVISTRT